MTQLREVAASRSRTAGGPLEDLLDLVEHAAVSDLPAIAGRLREAELRAELRLRSIEQPAPAGAAPAKQENISVGAAARRLGVSASYVYKNASELPFVVRIGRRVVCDVAALERWAKQRPGGRGPDAR